VTAARPCDGGVHRLTAWFGNAGEQNFSQTVYEWE
jgi:hypothetical protein